MLLSFIIFGFVGLGLGLGLGFLAHKGFNYLKRIKFFSLSLQSFRVQVCALIESLCQGANLKKFFKICYFNLYFYKIYSLL